MSEQLLQQILAELKNIKSDLNGVKTDLNGVKSQLNENTQLTRAIMDRQEETDPKLESLTMDVHKMHGDVTSVKDQLAEIRGEVEFTYHKTAKNEMELFKLRRDFN